jgi:hypothetical protein
MTIEYELHEPNTRLGDFTELVEEAVAESGVTVKEYSYGAVRPDQKPDLSKNFSLTRGLSCKIICEHKDNYDLLFALAHVALEYDVLEDSYFFQHSLNGTIERVPVV